jgi:hypothetical protein
MKWTEIDLADKKGKEVGQNADGLSKSAKVHRHFCPTSKQLDIKSKFEK